MFVALLSLIQVATASAISPQIYMTGLANSGINQIERFNTDGTGLQTLYSTGGEPNGIAVDVSGSKMYWTDFQTKTVMRANLNGSSVQTIATAGISEPQGIAVDPFAGKVYWTDDGIGLSSTSSIVRANLDGSGAQNLFPGGVGQPVGISLDLLHGKMYWANNVGNRIERANLDGSNLQVVYQVPFPTVGLAGIAVDPVGGLVYATENLNDRILAVNLDGSNPHTLLFIAGGDPLGLAVDPANQKIYWTDNGTQAVYAANLDGTNSHSIISFDTGATGQTPNFIALDTLPVPEPPSIVVAVAALAATVLLHRMIVTRNPSCSVSAGYSHCSCRRPSISCHMTWRSLA